MPSLFPSPPYNALSLITLFSLLLPPLFTSPETFPFCNQTFSCGHLTNISYPFSGGHRPDYCGLPGFQLSCFSNSTTFITINSLIYRVLQLNQLTQSLLLSREDLFDTICTNDQVNTTLNNTLFSFGSNNEVLTLFYGCDDSVFPETTKPLNAFTCEIDGKEDAYYWIGPLPKYPVLSQFPCSAAISVPVLLDFVNVLASNRSLLGAVLKQGFNVSYSNPLNEECLKCHRSGGECGFTLTSGHSLCICDNDRPCPVAHRAFVAGQNITQYQNCSGTFNCGNITSIGYPFWGSSRPSYCGHPKFWLNCSDGTAEIEIEGLNYRVLEINSQSRNLKVTREDYIGDICPDPHVNTTLDWQVMDYASGIQNVTLYYNCPAAPFPPATNQSNSFTCSDGTGFFMTSDSANMTLNNYAESCGTKVLVPGSQSAIQAMENTLRETPGDLLIALEQGFGVQWGANNSLCETCTESGGICGYNSSFVCYCSDGQRQLFTCPIPSPPQMPPSVTISGVMVLIIGVTTSAATVIITSLGCYYCFKRKIGIWKGRKSKHDENVEAFISDYHSHMPQRYSYSSIKRITNSFSDKLGQGGFGGVYKGKLSDGRLVAVKLLKESMGEGKEFINEVASISRTSHVNIVTLLGFCYEKTKRALVYEYMPNGSLDKFVCRSSGGPEVGQLEKKTKFEIAIGIARGLEYLHRGCNTRIVHFDIKPHNILLDQDFCPKIADFGLAKLCKGKESIVSMLGARGTAGYIAPEVFMRGYGGVSYKSDVYSYGMMMLEMFAGKKTVDTRDIETNSDTYFPDFIYKNLERGKICGSDEKMEDEEEETVRRMTIVGLWCIQTNPTERPSMTRVIEMLEGTPELLQVPPKPALFSSPKPSEFVSSSTYVESSIDEGNISIVTP